jgi:hypothetical protein
MAPRTSQHLPTTVFVRLLTLGWRYAQMPKNIFHFIVRGTFGSQVGDHATR